MLQSDFDIPINHYVEVDLKSFQAVVNAIGKVSLYFPYPTRDGTVALSDCCLDR